HELAIKHPYTRFLLILMQKAYCVPCLFSQGRTMSLKKAWLAVCLASLPLVAQAQSADLTSLIEAAKKEGRVDSVGMPDSWANWKDTWADLKTNYGLEHQDTDMSSAQEIAKFAAEK